MDALSADIDPTTPWAKEEEIFDGLRRRIQGLVLERRERNVGKINQGNDELNDTVWMI